MSKGACYLFLLFHARLSPSKASLEFLTWSHQLLLFKESGFPGNSAGKESACNAGDPSSIPALERSPGEGIGYPLNYSWASLLAQLVKNLPVMQKTWVRPLGWEDPLEEGMATHSSILAWRIPRDREAWKDAVRGGTVDKNLPANAGEMILILVWEDSTEARAPQLLEWRNSYPHTLGPARDNY